MSIAELVEQTKLPEEYLTFLRGILDGTETDYDEADEQLVEKLESQLAALNFDEE